MFDNLLGNWIGNASILEILWTLNSVLGIVISTRNWNSAWKDYRVIGGITNGRRAIAVGTLITETLIVAKFSIYIGIGLSAISLPNSDPPNVIGIIVGTSLLVSSGLLTAISLVNRRTSQYLLKHGMQVRDSNGRFAKAKEK